MRDKGSLSAGLVAVAVGVLMLVSSTAAATTASTGQIRNGPVKDPGASCDYVTFIYFYVGTYDANDSEWACTIHATDTLGKSLPVNGWANTIFEVSCVSPACNAKITITDAGFYGNHYSLWVTDDTTFATDWAKVGSTPQVYTSGALVAPSYNKYWTGTGSKYSSGTFYVYDPKYVALFFAVHDDLMNQMTKALDEPCNVSPATLFSSGCSVSGISVSGGWSPASFDTTWSEAG